MSGDDLGGLLSPPHAESSAASLRDRFLQLRTVAALEGLDDEGLLIIAEHAHRRRFRKGEIISLEGEATTAVRTLITGAVTLRRGERPPVHVARGEGFGLFPLMADLPADGAIAAEDSEVLEIAASNVLAAYEENHSLIRSSLRFLSQRLARTRRQLPADPAAPPSLEEGEWFERSRSLVGKLIALRKGRFRLLNIDALVDLARLMVEVRVPAGHVFWRAGERPSFALHVAFGRVRCTAPSGESVAIGCDFTVGVTEAWSVEPRLYELRAETAVIAYRIDYEDFLVITEMHLSVGLDMLQALARQYLAQAAVVR